MKHAPQSIERDADGIPKCEECGSSNWTKDGDGLSAGLFSCADCGYLPKAWRRERIREVRANATGETTMTDEEVERLKHRSMERYGTGTIDDRGNTGQ